MAKTHNVLGWGLLAAGGAVVAEAVATGVVPAVTAAGLGLTAAAVEGLLGLVGLGAAGAAAATLLRGGQSAQEPSDETVTEETTAPEEPAGEVGVEG